MTVAVVTADVVHAFPITAICARDTLVVALDLLRANLELQILQSLTESKIIDRDVVGACKVVDYAVTRADASVANRGNQPRQHR